MCTGPDKGDSPEHSCLQLPCICQSPCLSSSSRTSCSQECVCCYPAGQVYQDGQGSNHCPPSLSGICSTMGWWGAAAVGSAIEQLTFRRRRHNDNVNTRIMLLPRSGKVQLLLFHHSQGLKMSNFMYLPDGFETLWSTLWLVQELVYTTAIG